MLLSRWLSKIKSAEPRLQRMVLLGLVGVVLIVAGNYWPAKTPVQPSHMAKPEPQAAAAAGESFDYRRLERAMEEDLTGILTEVKGAGHVRVDITLSSGVKREFAQNINRDIKRSEDKTSSRITTEQKENLQVLLHKSNGHDEPLLVCQLRPAISGVLIVADGAADSRVKRALSRAAEINLDVAAHRIIVMARSLEGK